MTPDDIIKLSENFKTPDPEVVMENLSSMTRLERKLFSQLCFELSRRTYSSILEKSINKTFKQIHKTMERLFFKQIFHVNENLKNNPEKWKAKIETLREINLFAETSDFDLFTIAENIEEIKLKANEPFLKQYEEVTGVYLLKDSANVFEFNSKVPVITRNGIFGDDVCATGGLTSSLTVRPIVDCNALFIPREKFVKLSRSVPGLQEKVFHAAVDRAKHGSVRAEEQRRLTQEILDNIGQGSFSINVAGEIGENYTALAVEYLGVKDLAGIPFADLAFRKDRETLRNYYRALHMLFGGKNYNHEIVLDLLPNEVSINERSFKLYYSFVQDGAGHVMSVFIRMEDITLEQELAEKEELERAINMKMQRNIGGFMDMLDEMESSFMSIEQFADEYWAKSKQPSSKVIREIMRNLHGAKGLCGQFELNNLKSIIHDFEDWFLAIDKKSIGEQPEKFKGLYMDFEQELQFALSFKENLGEGIVKILNGVSLTQKEFENLENAAWDGDLTSIKSLIINKSRVDVKRIVSNWKKDVVRLAEKLNKKVVYKQVINKEFTISKDLAKALNTNLAHLYRNCIDHGIETPEQRIKQGKGNTGKILVAIDEVRDTLVIDIADDGEGIDGQKISQIAIENESLDQDLVKTYIDNEDYWKILFLPGFSSASDKTDISGRGVGMDAVKNTVESFGGKIEVQSANGVGTSFNIRIPLDSV